MGSKRNLEAEDLLGNSLEDKTKIQTMNNIQIPTEDPKVAKENIIKNIPPELEKVAEKFKTYLKSKEVGKNCFNYALI